VFPFIVMLLCSHLFLHCPDGDIRQRCAATAAATIITEYMKPLQLLK